MLDFLDLAVFQLDRSRTAEDRHGHLEACLVVVSFFLKKAAGLNKGGQEPGRTVAGKVTEAQVREIAEQKMGDMNAVDVDGAMAMVRGSARAMGLDVVEG